MLMRLLWGGLDPLPAAENDPVEHKRQLDDPVHQASECKDQHVLSMAGKAGYFCPYRGLSAGYGNMAIAVCLLARHYDKARNTDAALYSPINFASDISSCLPLI
jgi:hypothetical protein